MPDPAEFERTLRERYKDLLSPEEYAELRRRCGLGDVIDGDVVEERPALADLPHGVGGGQ